MNQLKIGAKVEREHTSTYDWVKSQCKSNHCPSNKEIAMHVAQDHISENPKYYTLLKKARL